MAHTLFTPEQTAKSVLAALRYLTVLPRTVRMDFSKEFVAGRGQTVNVLKPVSAGEAKVYTKSNRSSRTEIEFNDLKQEFVPVKLEDQLYNAVRLPDDWNSFTLENLEKQVLVPQAESVVDGLAKPLIDEMKKIKAPKADGTSGEVATSNGEALKFFTDGSNVRKVVIQLRKVLNARKVPQQNRVLAVGPGVEAAILQDELLQKQNESGTDSMLRAASIGNLFGFQIVADPLLPEDFAVAYHRDAFAFVTRPSRVPEGVAFGHIIAQDGFSLRHIMQYNPNQLEDQSIVDTFYGATTLDAVRAVAAGLGEAKAPGVGG